MIRDMRRVLVTLLGLATLAALAYYTQPARSKASNSDERARQTAEFRASVLVASPAAAGSSSADLCRSESGAAFMTWLEPRGNDSKRVALRFARVAPELGESSTILESDSLFVNWADVPHVVALSDVDLIVTFLERNGSGSYDYGVRFVCTRDGGTSWSVPRWLHDHVGAGEHGFVSLARIDARSAVAVWLDGRDTVAARAGAEHGESHTSEGAMSLRLRTLSIDGELKPELLLDERVCDCCQTDVAQTQDGAWLVAYRDRDEHEVRDIKVLRIVQRAVELVFDSQDHFQFNGCPVNGPAIAARGEQAALVWFDPHTAGFPRVRAATSLSAGRKFEAQCTLDDEQPTGRVEVLFERAESESGAAQLIALWRGEHEDSACWLYARFGAQLNSIERDGPPVGSLARAVGGRELGFPRAIGAQGAFLVALIAPDDGDAIVLRRAGGEG
jgi:hypothetical protein